MADTNTLIKDSYLMDEKLGAGLEKLWNAIQSEAAPPQEMIPLPAH
jgi:hypothetical protein